MNKSGDREIGWLFTNGSGRGSLINQGFDPVSVPLTEEWAIPDDVQILLIIDPKEPFLRWNWKNPCLRGKRAPFDPSNGC